MRLPLRPLERAGIPAPSDTGDLAGVAQRGAQALGNGAAPTGMGAGLHHRHIRALPPRPEADAESFKSGDGCGCSCRPLRV